MVDANHSVAHTKFAEQFDIPVLTQNTGMAN